MGPDERAIREVHSHWIEAVNAGDLVRLHSIMADDVVFLNPGQEPCGRDGFSPGFSAAHQQARIRCVSELEEVVVVGDIAHTRSRDSLSVIPRDGGKATRLAGHRMTIYRKQPDGRWLLARDAHTLSAVEDLGKDLLTQANAAIAKGDFEGFLSHCTEDVEWTFVGEQTLKGKEAVRQYMKETYVEPPKFDVAHLIAEGDFVTALGSITMKDENGRELESAYCDVWRIRDGKLAELKAFVVELKREG